MSGTTIAGEPRVRFSKGHDHAICRHRAVRIGRRVQRPGFCRTHVAVERYRRGPGTATWTAANGDQIRANVGGHGDIVEFPTVTITETHTITGGTGRFANASGIMTIERSANILTGASTGSLSGTISLGH